MSFHCVCKKKKYAQLAASLSVQGCCCSVNVSHHSKDIEAAAAAG